MRRQVRLPFAIISAGVFLTVGAYIYLRRKIKQEFQNVEQNQDIPRPNKFVVYYGSQTGTAESFAFTIAERISRAFSISAVAENIVTLLPEKLKCLSEDGCWFIFVISTHGEGEPTDSARPFFKWARKSNRGSLSVCDFYFTIMGLGNSQYTQFNEAGKKLNRLLSRLGGHKFCDRGEGDDDGDIDADFETWLEKKLLVSLTRYLSTEPQKQSLPSSWHELNKSIYQIVDGSEKQVDDKNNNNNNNDSKRATAFDYKLMEVVEIRELRQSVEGSKSTCHIELSLKNERISNKNDCCHNSFSSYGMSYETGDTVDILPGNTTEEIESMYERLSNEKSFDLSLNTLIRSDFSDFPKFCTLRFFLKYFVDLHGSVGREVFRNLSAFLVCEKEREIIRDLIENSGKFTKVVKETKLNLRECLSQFFSSANFVSSKLCFEIFLAILPKQKPRSYTISSSSLVQPEKASITVSRLVEMNELENSPGVIERSHEFLGLCSSYLCNQISKPDCHILGKIYGSPSLKLPNNLNPIIMICSGTGVAPFRGFLQELKFRIMNKKNIKSSVRHDWDLPSKVILIFGCTNSNKDFLYKEEINNYLNMDNDMPPILTHFIGAFSREQSHKIYVQHKLRQNDKLIRQSLKNERGSVFICGSVKMGNSVKIMLSDILGHKSYQILIKENRLVEEVWT